jgi:hypothetical protein
MTKINLSYCIDDKTVSVERELKTGEDLKEAIEKLLLEVEYIRPTSKATSGQMRALYGKALDRGWSKEKIREFLEVKLGTSDENEIVGKIEKLELSRIIDEIGGTIGRPDKVTSGQMRALWGKALDKGWSRDRVRKFLEEKLGTSKEEEIVGRIDRDTFSHIIDEVEIA